LFSGRILTIFLSFVVTPILTRLYSPEAYGYFSFFNAIAMNFTVISSLSYEKSLVIVKPEKKFYNLFTACFLLVFIFAAMFYLSLEAVYLWGGKLQLQSRLDQSYIHIIIAGCILYSSATIVSKWNIRRSQFKFAAKNGVYSQIGSRSTSLLFGFISAPIFGLIVSEIVGKLIIVIATFFKNVRQEWQLLRENVNLNEIWEVIKELKAYPKFILASSYTSTLINQLPIFYISFLLGKEILGNYSLALSIVYLPIMLITNTLSSVVLKKINDLRSNILETKIFLNRTINLLFVFTTPFFILLILFSDILFPFLFGENWVLAGQFASIISFYVLIDVFLIYSSSIMLVFEKEKLVFKYHLIHLLSAALGIMPGVLLNDFKIAIIGYGLIYVIFGIFKIHIALRLVKLNLLVKFAAIYVILLITLILKFNYFN
jgi:O-antigen/teichoic acid export membrane protein